jgi:enoyl-CoA hydratase/carnithine racemase
MTDLVLYETRGPVAVLTLNRTATRNAVDAAMAEALGAAVARIEADAQARVAVLASAGDVFSAGMDLKAFLGGEGDKILFGPGRFAGFVDAERKKPIIAAVEGPALAGGFEIALACDMIVASKAAVFGLPEVSLGIFAVAGGAFRLSRRIPPAKALELCLTAERIGAAEAHELGLLNALVDPGQALKTAMDLAVRIAGNAPDAVAASLRLARASQAPLERELWALSEELWASVSATLDAEEGPRAFVEKREPIWTQR